MAHLIIGHPKLLLEACDACVSYICPILFASSITGSVNQHYPRAGGSLVMLGGRTHQRGKEVHHADDWEHREIHLEPRRRGRRQ